MNAPRLHAAVSGNPQDPPIVFLHGFLGSHRDWSDVVTRIEDTFYCIAVDLPGHGASVGLDFPEAYTDLGICRLLNGTLDALGVATFHLVGYSMGGRAALRYALNHGDRVRSLMVESASPGLASGEAREARRKADREWADRLSGMTMRAFLEDWYRQPLFDSLRANPALYARVIEQRVRNDPRELARSLETMGAAAQSPMWDELPSLAPPTLFVAGEQDGKYRAISKRAANLCSRAQTVIVPKAGHNVHREHPDAFAALARRVDEHTR